MGVLGSADSVRPLRRDAPFYVAGHRGLVGSAVHRHLAARGFTALIGRSSAELDLRDAGAVREFFRVHRPVYVVLAAARVGGIRATATRPAEFLADNLRIQVNVLDAAREWDTDRPDGTPRKLLDVSRISALGWRPRIGLAEGIAQTYRWFTEQSTVRA